MDPSAFKTATHAPAGSPAAPTRLRRGLILAGMAVAYTLSTADRQLLVIVQEPLARDLGLTDTMLGLLSLVFALAYALASFPLAALADRGHLRPVIAATFTAWSALTVVCGLATSFLTILSARAGVAIGEAGCTPASHALISRTFPPKARASALALLMVGGILGSALAYGAGGWLTQHFGWRHAFYTLGAAGILLTPFVWFAIGRHEHTPASVSKPRQRGELRSVARLFWHNKPLRFLTMLGCASCFAGYGMGQWMASLLIRVHGLAIAEAGGWLFWAAILAGTSGALLGGFATDALGRKDDRAYALAPAAISLFAAPFALLTASTASPGLAVIGFAVVQFATVFITSPIYAVIQRLAMPTQRATAAALVVLLFNLVGMGGGPLLFGFCSDMLRALGLENPLQLTMILGGAAMLFGAGAGFRAARVMGSVLETPDPCAGGPQGS